MSDYKSRMNVKLSDEHVRLLNNATSYVMINESKLFECSYNVPLDTCLDYSHLIYELITFLMLLHQNDNVCNWYKLNSLSVEIKDFYILFSKHIDKLPSGIPVYLFHAAELFKSVREDLRIKEVAN
jgi:hypothetical protein